MEPTSRAVLTCDVAPPAGVVAGGLLVVVIVVAGLLLLLWRWRGRRR